MPACTMFFAVLCAVCSLCCCVVVVVRRCSLSLWCRKAPNESHDRVEGESREQRAVLNTMYRSECEGNFVGSGIVVKTVIAAGRQTTLAKNNGGIVELHC